MKGPFIFSTICRFFDTWTKLVLIKLRFCPHSKKLTLIIFLYSTMGRWKESASHLFITTTIDAKRGHGAGVWPSFFSRRRNAAKRHVHRSIEFVWSFRSDCSLHVFASCLLTAMRGGMRQTRLFLSLCIFEGTRRVHRDDHFRKLY